MTDFAIRTSELTRDFETVRAVDSLSIQVGSGTVYGFLGPNGSGKTTTIRLLLGLIPPTSGSAEVLGFDSTRQGDAIRAQTGALLEHSGLYERLTATENLEFFARIWRLSTAERTRRIEALLRHFGLWERRGERIASWSRGMRQKLAIARALLHQPKLVFLDEPTAGLDPVASASLRQDLARLAREEGVTVFLTTHNLSEAERLCDSVGVIYGGRLVGSGSPQDLARDLSSKGLVVTASPLPEEVVTRIGGHSGIHNARAENGSLHLQLSDDIDAGEVVSLLVGFGVSIQEVRPERGNLEDVFLRLVASHDVG